ncbi:MAG: elongation factor 4 [Candidatus Vogelbacteria bacterium]|nr:elongation factor 4 [Candidatus Vogelbacteria bacterium]
MAEKIRNFSIIAHIDHGKSTLADRLLERTGTIEQRKMKNQVLDRMDLERERGITIKMQPVRMSYRHQGETYEFNLIDTPGHIDFSYEVSRALQAVEGVILLIDATQGVQAQTLSVLSLARTFDLTIIPVLNKIDLPIARVEEVRTEVAKLLEVNPDTILAVSGKTGAGVDELLVEIVKRVPPPVDSVPNGSRALVFDFEYSTHRGVIVYVRVLDGILTAGNILHFVGSGEGCVVGEVGFFAPERTPATALKAGEIGYIVTGLKKPGLAHVGDTLTGREALPAVPGYEQPRPVVWASVYPESQDDFPVLKQALERLNLSDSAFTFEEESSGALGRGFRIGFLGMLHLEIITERLRREFGLTLIVATPTISYEVTNNITGETALIYSPTRFPEETKNYSIRELWVTVTLITPPEYLAAIMPLLYEHEAIIINTDNWSAGRTALTINMSLRELMRHFFDKLKSISSGFASLSYRIGEWQPAEVVRLDVLVNSEIVAAFSRVVARRQVEHEAKVAVEKLARLLPRQLIAVKIQAQALGRIISSETLSALRKDVTGYLYGGDITRKMKLREKQKRGKKKMQARGSVEIPDNVFLQMMRADSN